MQLQNSIFATDAEATQSDERQFVALADEFGGFVTKTVCKRNDGKFNQDIFDELMVNLFVKRHLLDGVTNESNPYTRLNVVRSILQENPYDHRATWVRVRARYGLDNSSEELDQNNIEEARGSKRLA
jgi:hypothetical protein